MANNMDYFGILSTILTLVLIPFFGSQQSKIKKLEEDKNHLVKVIYDLIDAVQQPRKGELRIILIREIKDKLDKII